MPLNDLTGADDLKAIEALTGTSGTLTKTAANTWALSSGVTPASHTHGNIQNGGTLQSSDITIASGDKLIVTDSSDSNKVARTSISFDGSTATKALTQKGTWETFNNYSHPTGAGNNHIPSGGSSGQYLKYSSSGTATWASLPTASTTGAGIIRIGTDATTAAAGNHTHSTYMVKGVDYVTAGKANGATMGNYATAEGSLTEASGNSSHAEGTESTASGSYSHAEGSVTVASGLGSHAEGCSTTASNDAAHAEGWSATASGNYGSHAEGIATIASGDRGSHAEGYWTTASGESSHAEGKRTMAIGNYSHAEGQGVIANSLQSHAEGGWYSGEEDYILISGAAGATTYTVDPQNSRSWSDQSFANTILSNTGFIYNNEYYTLVSWTFTTNNNEYRLATITMDTSLNWNAALDYECLYMALPVVSIGENSHAEGSGTVASGAQAHAEGYRTTAFGDYSHAEGGSTTASEGYSHSEGHSTTASGGYSHAEGEFTEASGTASHAEGAYTGATEYASHAEGSSTTASGYGSHAEGRNTTASGNYGSHAEGSGTHATGTTSHAEGNSTTASGSTSHAEGSGTTASGVYSHAEGYYTTAQRKSQHVFGEYNVLDTVGSATARGTYVEIVGNGTSSARANARTLDWNGNETLAGKLTLGAAPTANMDATTKQYVDNAISNAGYLTLSTLPLWDGTVQ